MKWINSSAMKLRLIAGIVALSMGLFSMTTPPETARYAGTYSYFFEGGRFGSVTVYPETDSTVLFYLDVNRGEPSYNMGMLYGRLVIHDGKGTYSRQFEYADVPCELSFTFTENQLVIESVNENDDCGFGFGVYADGTFGRTSSEAPAFFQDGEGTAIYFHETPPED